MPIHTVAPDKEEFCRIIGSFEMSEPTRGLVGCVGRVDSYSDEDFNDLVFVLVHEHGLSVFNRKDVEPITKKEFFKGCLGG